MPLRKLKYVNAVVILHGKSELIMAEYIKSNLHLRIEFKSKNKGKNSIQINGLMNVLRKYPFNSAKAMADEYGIEYDEKNNKLKNFKLFIIMDTDDCTEEKANKYKNKDMFKGHPLEQYIEPIYNSENLDKVMERAKIKTKKKTNSKGEVYEKIFPMNEGPRTQKTIDEVKQFADKIRNVNGSNLIRFVEYCISLASKDD